MTDEQVREVVKRYYRNAGGFELESATWFLGWTGEVDDLGHPTFRTICGFCKGAKTLEYFADKTGPRDIRPCPTCHGTGEEIGPFYCRECGELLPHVVGALCPQ